VWATQPPTRDRLTGTLCVFVSCEVGGETLSAAQSPPSLSGTHDRRVERQEPRCRAEHKAVPQRPAQPPHCLTTAHRYQFRTCIPYHGPALFIRLHRPRDPRTPPVPPVSPTALQGGKSTAPAPTRWLLVVVKAADSTKVHHMVGAARHALSSRCAFASACSASSILPWT